MYWGLYGAKAGMTQAPLHIDRDILRRNRWTQPQTGLKRNHRMSNTINAFTINDSSKVIGKNVLLVDDVYTTGETAEECAKT